MYILDHRKQGRSKTNLISLLKWRRTEAVRKIIELLYITLATLHQDATARKIYNYLTGSLGLEIWNQKISIKPFLACNDKSNFTTIVVLQWSCFSWFQSLMGLCNMKNSKWRKRNGLNIYQKKGVFLSFDLDLTYFSVMSFLWAWYYVLLALLKVSYSVKVSKAVFNEAHC